MKWIKIEDKTIVMDKITTEKRGSFINFNFVSYIALTIFQIYLFVIIVGIVKYERDEIQHLKNSIDSLKTNQYEANTQFLRLTQQLRKSVELTTEGFEGNREQDSLQTEALELLNKLSKNK